MRLDWVLSKDGIVLRAGVVSVGGSFSLLCVPLRELRSRHPFNTPSAMPETYCDMSWVLSWKDGRGCSFLNAMCLLRTHRLHNVGSTVLVRYIIQMG